MRAGDPGTVDRTVSCLLGGGLVVLPTDTVYGLAIRPGDEGARRRLRDAKARPPDVHPPVLVTSLAAAAALGADLSETARALAARFWPGALTIVMGFAPGHGRPNWLRDRDEVAVRMPDQPFVLEVLSATGPLLVTSANLHGESTPTSPLAAASALRKGVDLVVDGGELVAQPSCLVNVAVTPPVVERAGPLDAEELLRLGVVMAGAALEAPTEDEPATRAPAPGGDGKAARPQGHAGRRTGS